MDDARRIRCAEGYLDLEMIEDALAELDRLTDPKVADAFLLRAKCYFFLQDYAAAEAYGFLVIAEPDGNDWQNWAFLSEAAVRAKTDACLRDDVQEVEMKCRAEKAGAEILRLGCLSLPEDAMMHYECARFLGFWHRDEEAAEKLRRALELNPSLRDIAAETSFLMGALKLLEGR